jgi:hypothetical protein
MSEDVADFFLFAIKVPTKKSNSSQKRKKLRKTIPPNY